MEVVVLVPCCNLFQSVNNVFSAIILVDIIPLCTFLSPLTLNTLNSISTPLLQHPKVELSLFDVAIGLVLLRFTLHHGCKAPYKQNESISAVRIQIHKRIDRDNL
jgi:hypothetical protein